MDGLHGDGLFVGLVEEVYAAPLRGDGFATFARSLRRHLNARYVGFAANTLTARPTVVDGVEPAWIRDYQAHFNVVDPYCKRLNSLQVGQASSTEALLPHSTLLRSEFYNDFLTRIGVRDGVVAVVDRTESAACILTVLFDVNRHADEDEVLLVSRLLPHLRKSLAICGQLSAARAEIQLNELLLDQLTCAAFVLDSRGRLLRTNALANEMLSQADGATYGPGGLAASHPEDNRVLQKEISLTFSFPSNAASRPIVRLRRSDSGPLVAVVGPLIRHMADPLGVARAKVMVLIRDPQIQPTISAQSICRALGLTLAESRLVALMTQGLSLKESAEKLSVSEHTARSQLKAVFSKTGVQRQAELVRRVLLAVPSV